MKVLFLLFILNLAAGVSYITSTFEKQWMVVDDSTLEIIGKTNVNKFHCQSVGFTGKDTITEVFYGQKKLSEFNGGISLNAKGFDCHNSVMTRDFEQTIKANEFPEVRIVFFRLKQHRSKVALINGVIEVTVAGKTKVSAVTAILSSDRNGSKHIEGDHVFRFSDFEIEPPRRLLGAVRVEDKFLVRFHLVLKGIQV